VDEILSRQRDRLYSIVSNIEQTVRLAKGDNSSAMPKLSRLADAAGRVHKFDLSGMQGKGRDPVTPLKVLLVDDNDSVLHMMKMSLEHNGFQVVSAKSVTEALNHIVTQNFDVLITDLHMPNAGDGFAVVTAMRHAQPQALTLVVSGFPDVVEAMTAILLQADDVLVKPFDVKQLAARVRSKLEEIHRPPNAAKESVATILERDSSITIRRWLDRVRQNQELTRIPLSDQDRMGHLPELTKEVVSRLRGSRVLEADASASPSASAHGELRFRQGYTAPMMVQESRILQVCIFETLERNLGTVDFSLVLPDIMLIADEVDSQLTQSVDSFLTMQQSLPASQSESQPGRSILIGTPSILPA